MRTFAIISLRKERDVFENIVKHINKDEKIYIFGLFDGKYPNHECDSVEVIDIPDEVKDSESKIKNFVTRYFFEKNYDGFLHVIEDSVEIFNEPKTFISEIELMMTKLKLKSWFNTITDACNYTFNVYNPIFTLAIDAPELKSIYDKTISWTTHANTSWICYNFKNAEYSDFAFDENFRIPMFYIIKFLAERRNNKKLGEMYYMNLYPSINDEKDVFKAVKVNDVIKTTDEDKKKEHGIFQKMNINIAQDTVLEPVFQDLYNVLTNN
jgi:hypothetical protein